ncbi:hypothetical protein SMZ65_004384 [Cronobacter dublinensis]|nr:hypothetical protein [Cronobacter dublinensis]ELY4410091.1 hypothetical protein [Cronobacter dublinensis]ELY4487632.1 hypothetical protein [Cronobacter dublinensis]
MASIVLLVIVVAGLAVFPYRKMFNLLDKHVNVRVFFTGILLTAFGFFFKNVLSIQPVAKGADAIISQNSSAVLNIALIVGLVCIVASFFLRQPGKG